MKKLVAAVALSLALVPAAFAKEASTTVKISGWTCGGCASKTETALKKLDGVKNVKTDSDKGTAEVAYDDAKVTVAQLEKAVTESGFKVSK